MYPGHPDQLSQDLCQFWDTEAIGIVEWCNATHDDFPSDLTFDWKDGRYQIGLTWKSNVRPNLNCYSMCAGQLNQFYRCLKVMYECLLPLSKRRRTGINWSSAVYTLVHAVCNRTFGNIFRSSWHIFGLLGFLILSTRYFLLTKGLVVLSTTLTTPLVPLTFTSAMTLH